MQLGSGFRLTFILKTLQSHACRVIYDLSWTWQHQKRVHEYMYEHIVTNYLVMR